MALLFVRNVIQVEEKQACVRVQVIVAERHEQVFVIERKRVVVSINRKETASGLVVSNEIALDEVEDTVHNFV